ncbi:unnamed protein product [Miscanthus lutarioriparius]|uniref:Uncharacterized protein n=1 Tax=Miscanthus lutarioriparius TaxID=422564 RepID=A0A811SK67_9POAL|nr:unnamed protein product [Miscanthus lutarioriparius]
MENEIKAKSTASATLEIEIKAKSMDLGGREGNLLIGLQLRGRMRSRQGTGVMPLLGVHAAARDGARRRLGPCHRLGAALPPGLRVVTSKSRREVKGRGESICVRDVLGAPATMEAGGLAGTPCRAGQGRVRHEGGERDCASARGRR